MEKIVKIKEILGKYRAYNHAQTILSWDLETEAPIKAVSNLSKTIGILSELGYNTVVNDEFKELIYTVDLEKLNDIDKKLVMKTRKDIFDFMSKIPVNEYSRYSELVTLSSQKWSDAKRNNDIKEYAPILKEVIELKKKFIKYRNYEGHPYSLLLSDYEPNLTVEYVDEFFEKIKNDLVPFIKKVVLKRREELQDIKNRFLSKSYPIDKQKELSKEISKILKFNYDAGVLKESEHPFTTSTSNKDVRITTHYHENDPISAIYSTIHETGHALYEQHIEDIYDENFLGGGVSMGIHESQSRIYENMFGRNDAFVPKIYELMDKYFGMDISIDEFKLLLNESNLSYIRTESDELTYPLHILVRYELEKEIFSDIDKEVDVAKLVEKWNDKYVEYLGIKPKTLDEGILQDIHWAQGLFGYFPSYALGSAYSAQIYDAMSKDIDIEEELKNSKFENINKWLELKVQKFGAFLEPDKVILNATGNKFNSDYYIDYLKNKFSKIYGVEV